MQLYGQLFFLLQTSPEYIAHLTRMVSLKEIDGLLQIVMFTLYGNQYEDREEHLLLSMFEVCMCFSVECAVLPCHGGKLLQEYQFADFLGGGGRHFSSTKSLGVLPGILFSA